MTVATSSNVKMTLERSMSRGQKRQPSAPHQRFQLVTNRSSSQTSESAMAGTSKMASAHRTRRSESGSLDRLRRRTGYTVSEHTYLTVDLCSDILINPDGELSDAHVLYELSNVAQTRHSVVIVSVQDWPLREKEPVPNVMKEEHRQIQDGAETQSQLRPTEGRRSPPTTLSTKGHAS